MKKLAYSSAFYMVIGLTLGLFYREFTKMNGFTGKTQLAFGHTHALTLGVIGFLLFLILAKQFSLHESKGFNWFFYLYHIGLLLTIAMLTTHGILSVLGVTNVSATISGIAGLGHIFLTAAFVTFFIILLKRVQLDSKKAIQVNK